MINVNNTTKTAYLSDSIHKELTISFPDLNLTLGNPSVDGQNIDITERAITGTNIEFVGCMASVLHITLRSLSEDVSGQHIIVSMLPSVTGAESIVLFDGYVDQVKQVPHKTQKEITAYDILYNISSINVSDWYNDLSFPITIKDFRDSLFDYLGLDQEETTLVNDDISFDKDYVPTRLSAIDLIKSVCQINCVFGKIARDGTFVYLNAPTNNTPVSQALTKYKANDTTYSEYKVKPVNKLIIRTGTSECYAGDGTNKYIISENFFTKTLPIDTLQTIANRLYSLVSGFSFQPISANINGLPYIECLDKISLPVYPIDGSSSIPTIKEFVVLERTMKGLQAIRDKVVAEGNEYQHEFLSSVTVDIEELKAQINGLVQKEYTSYEVRNVSVIPIGEDENVRILFTRIASNTQTKAQIHIEVNLESEAVEDYTQGIVTYLIDSTDTEFYPTETWIDGNHVLHLMYILPLQANDSQQFEVYMRAVGGTITIPRGGLWMYASGAGLVGDGRWDGNITLLDYTEEWAYSEYTFEDAEENVSVLLNFAGEYLSTEDGEIITTEDGEELILEGDS